MQIIGRIKREGCHVAGKRLRDAEAILKTKGILFPPFFFGTVNLRLESNFPTPDLNQLIYISQQEIDSVAPGYVEWWKLIPVKKINGLDIPGYIYRTRQNVHGDGSAELISHNLTGRVDLSIGARFILEI